MPSSQGEWEIALRVDLFCRWAAIPNVRPKQAERELKKTMTLGGARGPLLGVGPGELVAAPGPASYLSLLDQCADRFSPPCRSQRR
jgi:hypothetical protein